MFTVVLVPVNARELYKNGGDSSDIPEEVLALLPLKEGDQVIRVYRFDTYSCFLEYKTIDAILDSDRFVDIHYVIRSSDGTMRNYQIIDGKCTDDVLTYKLHKVMDIYLEGEIIKEVDPEIIVESKYYIAGMGRGDVIYYKTNLGDYIYFFRDVPMPYAQNLGAFLFSVDTFYEYQHAVLTAENEYNAIHGQSLIGDIPDYDPKYDWDLTAYEIGSPNFNPNSPFIGPTKTADDGDKLLLICGISAGVCLVGAVTLVLILRQRRKKAAA